MGVPVVNIVNAVVSESEGYVEFTVILSEASAVVVSIDYASANGIAGGEGYGNDFAFTGTKTLDFAAGQTVQTIRVPLYADTGVEGAETFYLSLVSATNAVIGTGLASATLVDNDAPAVALPVLDVADTVVDETARLASIVLTLDKPSTSAVSVTVATLGGSASAGSDYTSLAPTVVTFAPGQTARTVVVALLDDASAEQPESFAVALSAVTGALLPDSRAVVSIGRSDSAPAITPTVSVADAIVGESQGYAEFVVSLGAPSDQIVEVSYAAANGSAGGEGYGNDFAFTGTQTLRFAPGETLKTLRVAIADDARVEGSETLYLNLSGAVGAEIGRGQATATIVDNDAPAGTPTLHVADVIVDERAGRAVFTFTLDRPSSGIVSAVVATQDGSALAAVDYTALAAQAVAFAPGETSKTVAVDLLDDAQAEHAEQFALAVTSVVGATLSSDLGAVATIGASDRAAAVAPPTVSVGHAVVNERQGYAEFLVTLSARSAADVSVTYAAANGSAGGEGYGNDFAFTGTQTLTFAPGETLKTVRVALSDTGADERTESLYLWLTSATNGVLGSSLGVATVREGTTTGPARLAVDDAVVDEKAGVASFALTLDRPTTTPVSVRLALEGGSAAVGLDASTADVLGLATRTVVFAPGQTSATVQVALVDDTRVEHAEQFALVLSSATGATLIDPRGIATIVANDGAGTARPTISVSDAAADERDGYAEFVVRLGAPASEAVSVQWTSANGSAGGEGYGNDFAFTGTHTLTFAPGEVAKTIRVALWDDLDPERAESLYVNLFAADGADLGRSQGVATIAASDNGGAMPTLHVRDTVVDEKAGFATVVLALDRPSASGSVTLSVATADGTALAGADYRAVATQTVAFAPGETSKTLRIALLDDSLAESAESFALTLSNVHGAALPRDRATVTIGAGDGAVVAQPALRVVSGASAPEGQAYLDFVVRLDAPSADTVRATYSTSNGTAGGEGYGNDFAFTGPQTISFAPGETVKTVRVALFDDGISEGDETLWLDITSATGAAVADAHGVAVIYDDDAAAYVAVTGIRVGESDGNATFVVRRIGPLANEISVTARTGDGTATAGADYVATTRVITFAPGEAQKSVVVPLVGDAVAEGTESFSVTLESAVGADIAAGYAVATIADDDPPGPPAPVGLAQLATFARAAYALRGDEPRTLHPADADPVFSNDEAPTADAARIALQRGGWQFLGALPGLNAPPTDLDGEFHLGFADGVYTSGNAAALVARHGDTLVVAFRGTNDARYTAGLNQLTPDRSHWTLSELHWQELVPLVAAVKQYAEAEGSGINRVLVTGHSLGAAMVQPFMDAVKDTVSPHAVSYRGFTFASPGYGLFDIADGPRVTNLLIEGDFIQHATWIGATVGDENFANLDIRWDVAPGSVLEAQLEKHSMDLYLHVAERLTAVGIGVDSLRQRGDVDADDIWMALDAQARVNDPVDPSDDSYAFADPATAIVVVPSLHLFPALLIGGTGRDRLTAASGDDGLYGGTGNDTLDGRAGNDLLDGGAGVDSVSYAWATTGVAVVLTRTDAQPTGGGGTDTLLGIEHVFGSAYADTLTGSAAANSLIGNDGNDTLAGVGGNDTLRGGVGRDSMLGGSGNDVYHVDDPGDVVTETVSLASDVDTVSSTVNWTLGPNVEKLVLASTAVTGRGNELANTLTGNVAGNSLAGLSGNDTLSGLDGNDSLYGGHGSDSVSGGAGNDRFVLNSRTGSDLFTDFETRVDQIAVSMNGLRIGDGDTTADGARTRTAPGGFAPDAELVIFTANATGLGTTAAATAIGSASAPFAVGRTALYVVDNGASTALFLFTAADANAAVSASELTLLSTLATAPSTALVDYLFVT